MSSMYLDNSGPKRKRPINFSIPSCTGLSVITLPRTLCLCKESSGNRQGSSQYKFPAEEIQAWGTFGGSSFPSLNPSGENNDQTITGLRNKTSTKPLYTNLITTQRCFLFYLSSYLTVTYPKPSCFGAEEGDKKRKEEGG